MQLDPGGGSTGQQGLRNRHAEEPVVPKQAQLLCAYVAGKHSSAYHSPRPCVIIILQLTILQLPNQD